MKSLEDLFSEVIAFDTAERDKQCKRLCGNDKKLQAELESLLCAAKSAKGFLSQKIDGASILNGTSMTADQLLGQRLGSFKLVRELDSGGMGIVFLAERVDGHYQQQVAIKLARFIDSSEEALQRFHTERQILANLQHPNIAQLLDGGTSTDGRPYLVMEYVTGESIEHYCIKHALSTEDILQLICTVCDAAQYAHQNLIVHCDIKPPNILVTTDGMVKLLDFGIATLLQSTISAKNTSESGKAPQSHGVVCTPEYAAPEQVNGGMITTATDVYAIGVVLYKLVSGSLPAQTLDQPPVPPCSIATPSLSKNQSSDLDNIILKALDYNPKHRYPSAQHLANDLQAFLAERPVSASKATAYYRSVKFIRRHGIAVALTTFAAFSLIGGTITSTWQWRIAKSQQGQAERRYDQVRDLASSLIFDFPDAVADLPGSIKQRTQQIETGVDYLDKLLLTGDSDPKLRRKLAVGYQKLAKLQGNPMSSNLGNPALAAATFNKSIKLQNDLLIENPSDIDLTIELARNYMLLAGIHAESLGQTKKALGFIEKCFAVLKPFAINPDPELLRILIACYSVASRWHNSLAQYQLAATLLDDAEKLYESSIETNSFAISPHGYRLRARIHEERAEIAANTGQPGLALEHEKERLRITLTHLSKDPSAPRRNGTAYHAYAARLAAVGQSHAAQEAYVKAIEFWTFWQEKYPSDVSATEALVVIYAELATQLQLAPPAKSNLSTGHPALTSSCTALEKSVMNLRNLSSERIDFPKRYSWSPNANQIHAQYTEHCQTE